MYLTNKNIQFFNILTSAEGQRVCFRDICSFGRKVGSNVKYMQFVVSVVIFKRALHQFIIITYKVSSPGLGDKCVAFPVAASQ